MSQLKALIFDVDGTLAETERDGHRVAFNRAFSDAGLEWHWDESLYAELLAVTGGKERIRYFLEKYQNEAVTAELTSLIAELHKSKTNYYMELMQSNAIALRPGVERLLEEARRADLTLAISTTTTPANVDALLSSTLGKDALSWFDTIAAGDVVPLKKPAPDIYHYCLEQMDMPAEACLAIEDSANGLKASLGAQITTIITLNDYTKNEDFSGAALVVDQLGEADRPCQVIAGAVNTQLIDIETLKAIHGE